MNVSNFQVPSAVQVVTRPSVKCVEHFYLSPVYYNLTYTLNIFRYFTFLVECKEPKACTILLRGASKDILMEVERNLQDALNVARNVMTEPQLVPGGGASEMALATVGVLVCCRVIFTG